MTASSMGVGAPKFIIWLTMSPGSNEKEQPGNLGGRIPRSFSSKAATSMPELGPQRHVHHRFMRPAGPQKNRIDGITRALRADITQADVNVARPGRSLDLVQDARHKARRLFRAGSGGSVKSQAKLMARDVGKKFPAHTWSQNCQDRQRRHDVDHDHQAAERSQALPRTRLQRSRTRSKFNQPACGVMGRDSFFRCIHRNRTGSRELESRNEATMANATASESGTNKLLRHPCHEETTVRKPPRWKASKGSGGQRFSASRSALRAPRAGWVRAEACCQCSQFPPRLRPPECPRPTPARRAS